MADLPLLPSDRYIADLLGLSEEQYRYYMAEVRRRAAEGPQPAVVADAGTLAIISLVSTLISIGLTIAASFFKPSSKASDQPRLVQNQVQGGTLSDNRRYTPRQGFDSLQDVVGLGTPVPLVYAKRELIGGQYYGGIRVNAPLLFSNILSFDKGQLLRAIFLIGEGDSSFLIDHPNTAIGNNTFGAYLLGDSSTARFTVYYRANGGRIASADRVLGASNDIGSFSASNVFGVRNSSGTLGTDFCHAHRPNTQTQFGVYTLIGNGLGYRINPQLRPSVNASVTLDVKSTGGKRATIETKGRVVCDQDFVALAQRRKYAAKFSGRSCLYDASGDEWEYYISKTTDALTVFSPSGTGSTWSGDVAVSTNPFETISSASLEPLVGFSSITSSGSSVSGTVTFSTSGCNALINAKSGGRFVHPLSDGLYVIGYTIWFGSTNGKQVAFDFPVEASITNPTSTPATALIPGRQYVITSVGTSVFTLVGANSNSVGTVFTATGTTPGTGTARDTSLNRTVDYTNTTATYTGEINTNASYEERCGDAASAIAGRQKTWDDAIQIGELYKLGTAIGICTQRSPDTEGFSSEADYEPISTNNGRSITAKFKIVRSGSASTISISDVEKDAKSAPAFKSATESPHLYRLAVANFATIRECYAVSIVIRSSLGIRITGLCNFRDSLTYEQIDGRACKDKEGKIINPGDSLSVDIFNSGQMSSSEERYSFFRIGYREAGTSNAYTTLPQCYGIRGITQQNVYNTIRLSMPSTKRWEFQIEPLSGWEIRSNNASGDLELLDSSSATFRTFTTDGVEVRFRGVSSNGGPFIASAERATKGPEVFRLTSTQRGAAAEIGLGYSDGSNYADAWGKLAEAFVYEEIRSSAESGPEHEIVAVNEFVANVTAPQYNNLAILGLNMRAGVEWQQFGQLSVYVLQGLQNTHLFPVILKDLLTNTRYGRGDMISMEQIDTASFDAATTWCSARKLFFDGAITGKINIRQWAADVAAAHLLLFGEAGGKFWLRPAWPGTVASPSAVTFKGIFSAGNIVEGSFAMEFFEPEDRRPIQVSVRYREERLSTNLDNPGLFPVEREVLVREASPNGSDSDPIESLDLSDYCTSKAHAIDAAKFVIRMRRIPDHAVKFTTTHEGIVAAIEPGDYIRVVMDITHYDDLRNGAVLADGTLVSTQPFADGSYTVLAWDGSSTSDPGQTTLTVTNGGTKATPTGRIFTLVNARTQTRTYQIERITPSEDGGFSIEAVHMPTNSSDILLLAEGFDTAGNWVITE